MDVTLKIGEDDVAGLAEAIGMTDDRAEYRCGFGECTVSGCICSAFMGSGDLCENCTHNFSFHS